MTLDRLVLTGYLTQDTRTREEPHCRLTKATAAASGSQDLEKLGKKKNLLKIAYDLTKYRKKLTAVQLRS